MQEIGIDVPRGTLYKLEREAAHVTSSLEELVDQLPSKFRKQVRGLSQESADIYKVINRIRGLHWFTHAGVVSED